MHFDLDTGTFAALTDHADAAAVIARARTLSWRALHAEAQAWVLRARALGLRADQPILIRGHQEADFMVAICGALLMRAPFVPLDIIYPPERVQAIAAELDAALLYDAGAQRFEVLHEGAPRPLAETGLAYIIFTSGTTGTPKGVQIGVESVRALAAWMALDFGLGAAPVFLNHAAFSFDLSMYAVFGALALGGAIVLVDRAAGASALEVAALIAEHRVITWVSTPSFAQQQLLNPGFTQSALPSLRTLLFCGEPLNAPLARQLRQRFAGLPILNTYGPTEATVATTWLALEAQHLEHDGILPIGRPKRDSQVYCEDGELCIVGPHVMRGYLNRDDLNRTRMFMRDGQRGFRSGDLGVLDAAGMLWCHGRIDEQIKLNGYRMELLEIDAALAALPGHRAAASVPLRRPNGTVARLVAYVAVGAGAAVLPPELADWKALLAQRLPAYMIPSELRVCAQLPVSVNYKVDRVRLAQAYREGGAP